MGFFEDIKEKFKKITLGWHIILKSIMEEIAVKGVDRVPIENFENARDIIKQVAINVEHSTKFSQLRSICAGLFEVFDKSANLLRGKVSTDAITFIEAIRQMSEEVLNSKDEKELSLKINPINNKQYKRIGIFKSKLTEYLRILSRHMEVYVKTKS